MEIIEKILKLERYKIYCIEEVKEENKIVKVIHLQSKSTKTKVPIL